jgi:hypothetical protein
MKAFKILYKLVLLAIVTFFTTVGMTVVLAFSLLDKPIQLKLIAAINAERCEKAKQLGETSNDCN